MATGRLGVSRTRDFYNSSKTEYDNHYRNGTHRDHDVKQKSGLRLSSGTHRDHDVKQKSGLRLSSGAQDLVSRKDGFGFWSKIEAREEWKNDGVRVLPGKKRKFSPIVWDREEKEAKRVRIWSKNRVVPTGTANLSPQSLNGSSGEVLYAVSDGGVSEIPLSANHVHGREILPVRSQMACGYDESVESEPHAALSPSLSQEQFGSGDLEDVVEDRDFVEAPNILMSRWASDSNSPRGECLSDSDTEDFPKRKPKVQDRSRSETILDVEGTSPESGEFRREGSEDGVKLSGSEERSCIVGLASENEYFEKELDKHDFMDCGKTPDKNAGVSPVNSDFEDDGNSSWSEEPRINMLEACRSVFEYERLNKINEGTYGVVYKARDKKTGEFVALKKVKMDVSRSEEGFPLTSLREINILLSFRHPSIVNVKQVAMGDLDSVFMVMEYMEHDLKGLIEVRKHPFRISEVKCLMLQLLEGVRYLHDNWVLHRDLKPSNLLMNNRGDLKICDFGMSRQYGGLLKPYTALVVTLWYRAPELLLGSKNYSTAIDMWSVGCIMAELLAKEPLFKGKTEIEQLDKIFKTLGTPNETSWPGYSKLPGVKGNFVKQPYNLLRKKFPATSFIGSPTLTDSGFDLLNKLLTYDPEKRISAEAALNHDWFQEVPLPTSKDFMPTFPVPHSQYLTR